MKELEELSIFADDPKYDDLRKELSDSGKATSLTIISTVSAALAAALSFEVGAIVVLVCVCLYALAKIGKAAYCKTYGPGDG